MTTNQIIYFLAVVKYKTFTQAAEELYISQSSLSKQIKALEQELDCTLFSRDNKLNTLTAEGEIFLIYAEKFSESYQQLMASLNSLHHKVAKQEITVGVLPVISEYNLHKHIALFQNLISPSDSYVNLIEGTQEGLLNLLHAKKIDSAVIRTDRMDLTDYDYVNILEEELVLVYSDKYKTIGTKDHVTLSDIIDYPIIAFDESSSLHRLIQTSFQNANLQPNYIYIYKRHEQILSMVNAGCGISLIPRRLVSTDIYPNIRIAKFDKPLVSHTALIKLKTALLQKQLSCSLNFLNLRN